MLSWTTPSHLPQNTTWLIPSTALYKIVFTMLRDSALHTEAVRREDSKDLQD